MTIQLSEDVESSINAELISGHFASADDAVAEIVRKYFEHKRQGEPHQHAAAQPTVRSSQGFCWMHTPISICLCI